MTVKTTKGLQYVGKIVSSLILVGALSAGVYGISNFLFRIRTIEVVGKDVYVAVDHRRISRNLLFFPSEKMKQTLLSDNPLLKSVQFRKKFPHTLVIEVTAPIPIARLVTPESTVLVDKTGLIVGLDTGQNSLPLLRFNAAQDAVGNTVTDEGSLLALQCISILDKSIHIDEIAENDGMSLLMKIEQTSVIIPRDVPIGQTVATLQTLITGFRIKGTLPKVVDLRFDKPVITF